MSDQVSVPRGVADALESTAAASIPAAATDGGVTGRAVMLSLILALLFGYIIPIIDVRLANTFLGAAHLPPGAIAVLLVLLLVINPLLNFASRRAANRVAMLGAAGAAGVLAAAAFRFWTMGSMTGWVLAALAVFLLAGFGLGHRPLSRNESLTIYITTLFSCLVPGHGSENFFISNIIGPFYFATAENKWLDFLSQNLPQWISPALHGGAYHLNAVGAPGYDAIQGWYNGTKGNVPWFVWVVPLAAWSSLVLASYVMLGCLSVILRSQWAQREALAFPLLRLPLEMTEEDGVRTKAIGPFFRNNLMWIGFAVAASIQLINGLHVYFPDVPQIPLTLDGNYFTEAPWNQIGWTPFQVFPIAVGITYLLTSEVSFSLWFFYWFIKFQYLAAYFLGFSPASLPNALGATGGAKAFTGYEQVGCYVGYVLILLWTAREHLGFVMRRAFGLVKSSPGEAAEALSYPVAFWGFILSFAFIIGWSIMSGMSPPLAIALWLAYLVIAIALTRIVVEAGLLFVQQGWLPLGTLAQITQSGPGTWMPASGLVPASIVQGGLMTDLRAFLMPSFLQGFKLAHERGIKAKPLMALIAAVILIAFSMSVWMNVKAGYSSGGLSLEPWFAQSGAKKPAGDANLLIHGVQDASWLNMAWMGVGVLMTYGMMLARSRVLWFPLHPVGLLMSITYPMNRLWFSILIGWLCKVLITRFGGSDTYRKATPLFLGLALGDVAMMIFWLVIDGWQGRTFHQLMPS